MISPHTYNINPAPKLSVLVPYYHDDPSDLLRALIAQSSGDVEILLYDDGTADAEVNKRLQNIAKTGGVPVTLLFAAKNMGRSYARNSLQAAASAPWLLFLDADMMPEDDAFLTRYSAVIDENSADIIFGGFTMPERVEPQFELHRAFSAGSDCLTAEQRSAFGPKYVCSSNLAVRSAILDAQPFDTAFTGWGWEDSEWAARVAGKHRLMHLDNPAVHLGLESTDTMLKRFATSGQNYDRFVRRHPDLAETLSLFKAMRILSAVPFQGLMQAPLKLVVKSAVMPIGLRLKALKLWRASWYAETCDATHIRPLELTEVVT